MKQKEAQESKGTTTETYDLKKEGPTAARTGRHEKETRKALLRYLEPFESLRAPVGEHEQSEQKSANRVYPSHVSPRFMLAKHHIVTGHAFHARIRQQGANLIIHIVVQDCSSPGV